MDWKNINAYIVLTLLLFIIILRYSPICFYDLLKLLPGYNHNEDTGKNIVSLLLTINYSNNIIV